jgi:hypothetical protein
MQQPGILPGRSLARSPIRHAPVPRPATAAPGAADARKAPASAPPEKAAVNSPALPPSLMDKPARPARITLNDGLLTIQADNSSLSAILQHLTSAGGMTVDGFRQDQRVFGSYGPGNPRDVLSSLLQDAGYNFLIVGTTDQGTPKEIVLTARSGAGATSGPAPPESDDQAGENDDSDNNNSSPADSPAPERPAPIPGASTAPPNPDGQVKSPAEIIQELQRLRQQQTPQ